MEVTMIATSNELTFMIDEAGFNCINAIKSHLRRLGNNIDYGNMEVREKVGDCFYKQVTSIELNENDEVIVARQNARSCELSSMFINEQISVDDLLTILQGLEKIDSLKHQHYE